MNKQEFIERLAAALNGRIPASQVEDTIQYYRDYINTQLGGGKTEAEVMGALGDPRLIARTIIETTQPTGDNNAAYSTAERYRRDDYQDNAQEAYTHYQEGRKETNNYRSFRIPGWLLTIIIILVIFLILSVVFSVLTFLAPIIIVIVAVVFLVKLFRDWLN